MNGERILIDTSIWINYFKKDKDIYADKVDILLRDALIFVPKIVIAELIQGARSDKEVNIIEEFTSAFNIIDQGKETWYKAGILSYKLKKKGKTVNLTDCYIAIIACENNCKVFTLDPHFKDIKRELKELTLLE